MPRSKQPLLIMVSLGVAMVAGATVVVAAAVHIRPIADALLVVIPTALALACAKAVGLRWMTHKQ